MAPDYYKILGVEKSEATDDDIRKAYYNGALRWHPDKNPNDTEEAATRFKQLVEAYETLSDPMKRRNYDLGIIIEVQPPDADVASPAGGANASQWSQDQPWEDRGSTDTARPGNSASTEEPKRRRRRRRRSPKQISDISELEDFNKVETFLSSIDEYCTGSSRKGNKFW